MEEEENIADIEELTNNTSYSEFEVLEFSD